MLAPNVMISGINVGFVKNINLENSYPKITLMVNKNLKISMILRFLSKLTGFLDQNF